LTRCLPNTSTFVPNDRSQCLYCVLPIIRCAFGALVEVVFAERLIPYRFIGTVDVSFPRFREGGRLLIRQNRWLCALCSALTAAVKMKLSDDKELPESHADTAHGETETII